MTHPMRKLLDLLNEGFIADEPLGKRSKHFRDPMPDAQPAQQIKFNPRAVKDWLIDHPVGQVDLVDANGKMQSEYYDNFNHIVSILSTQKPRFARLWGYEDPSDEIGSGIDIYGDPSLKGMLDPP